MKMNHLLLEIYCDYDKKNTLEELVCKTSDYKMGIHCFKTNCKYFSYTKCPNEIAYVNEEGIADNELYFIGFGGEMDTSDSLKREKLIETWKNICVKKMDEAYKTYMNKKNSENK